MDGKTRSENLHIPATPTPPITTIHHKTTGGVVLQVFDKVRVHVRVEGGAASRDAVVYALREPKIPGLPEPGGTPGGAGARKRKQQG